MLKHSHHYAILAILFGILSIGGAIAVKISAQTTTTTTTTIAEPIVCAYTTSDWSECSSSGIQTRKITSRTPVGCYDKDVPSLTRSCTYTNVTTTTAACSYTYSSWSECSTSGTQTRTVTSKTPSGCVSTAEPILRQTCTYVPTTNTTSIVCAYTTSEWSTCSSSGIQTRTIASRTPIGCYDKDVPQLQRTCTPSTSTSTSTSTNSSTSETADESTQTTATTTKTTTAAATSSENSSVTPSFNFLNINGGEVISGTVKIQGSVERAYSVEFYLVPADSNSPRYLGLAKRVATNVWEYSFDSSKQPNGSFYIKTKIKNAYGTYDGDRRMIIILNSVSEETKAVSDENATTASQTLSENEAQSIIDRTTSEWQEKYFKSTDCVDEKICGGDSDPDQDGLSNNEEYRYGTNPTNPDTDSDGFLDGDEVKNGFNPLKASPGDKSDKIVFESPKESGEVKSETYEVENVEMVKTEEGSDAMKISGKGLPNSFVTIYIYSDPVVLTVKTDADGNWSYNLDKDLEEGDHQVYVAVTDNTGKITYKSEPLAFVKTAQAVNVIPPAEAAASKRSESPTKLWTRRDLILILTFIMGALALTLASIGLYKHNVFKKEINNIKES